MNKQYLFVNENIFTFNSGTEFSAMNRQRLFRNHHVNSKIVTRDYNQGLHQEMKKNGLTNDDVLNMFDYFQGTTHVPYHHVKLRYSNLVDKRYDKIIGVNSNYSLLKRGQRTVARVNIFPLTVGEVGAVLYYDDFGHVTSKDIWDCRGFKSKTIFMHPDGRSGDEIIYNYQGVPVMEITHMYINHKTHQVGPTMFKLLNYKGHDWRFNTEDDLFTFFLDQITAQKPTVLINDRPTLTKVVADVTGAKKKYQYLHNEQTTDPRLAGDPKGKLFPVLMPLFHKYINSYDGLITPTLKQAKDLNKLFPEIKVQSVSDTALSAKETDKIKQDLPAKRDNIMVYIGRIAKDKHIDQLINIANTMKSKVPNFKLVIAGYFESIQYQKALQQQVKNLHLEKVVKFPNYLIGQRKENLLKHAKVMIQASYGEGLSMSLVEGLMYGLPEVAYDVNYGPNYIIKNGQNGYLVNAGNYTGLSKYATNIMTNDKLWHKLSNNALKQTKEFSEQSVMKHWSNILK